MTDWSDLDALLAELRRRHWTLHLYGERTQPTILAAVHAWPSARCADVIILRGHDRAVAYRVPAHNDSDPFAPDVVHWWWARWNHPDAAHQALRAVFKLAAPQPDAVAAEQPPACCHIPADQRRLVTIRPI